MVSSQEHCTIKSYGYAHRTLDDLTHNYVYVYYSYMANKNVTLSFDPHLLAQAKRVAQRRGTSINAMLRNYLTSLVSQEETAWVDEFLSVADEVAGESERPWKRDELYDV